MGMSVCQRTGGRGTVTSGKSFENARGVDLLALCEMERTL